MYVRDGKPQKQNHKRLMQDYYEYESICHGKTIFHGRALKKIEQNDLLNSFLCLFDPNYWEARVRLTEAEKSFTSDFIGLYADNDKVIAHCNIIYITNEDGMLNAKIENIYIHRIEELLASANRKHVKWIYGIYDVILSYIENCLETNQTYIDYIECDTFYPTTELLEVFEQRGYQKIESPEGIKYCKKLREKGVSRARSNFNQQNN